MQHNRAFITGVAGQDGSYLAEFLLRRGYEVHGMVRRSSAMTRSRIDGLDRCRQSGQLTLHYGDMSDSGALRRLIERVQPDETYNLAAQSHVHISFDQPGYTADVNAVGTLRLLEAIRSGAPQTRFFQASSSEMFGNVEPPHRETTPFHPRSPYAVAKAYAHHITVNYREAHGLFACCGIMFNHESPRRAENFVTRKVTRGVAHAVLTGGKLVLGNLDSRRDWGHAQDYVEAMWLMLQQQTAEEYVIGTGRSRSVRDLVDTAFAMVGLDWRKYVELDQRYYRPSEVGDLVADAKKARERLAWRPRITFEQMLREMLEHDLREIGIDPVHVFV